MNIFFDKLVSFTMVQILGIGLILGALYYYFLYDDGSSIKASIASINVQIVEEEKKKKETEVILKEEASMRQSVGQLSAQYQEIAKHLPSTLFSIDINRSIDAFAKNAGVSVKAKRPGIITKEEIVDEVPVDVALEGTYAELAQFVYYVSTAEKLTRVKNFSISQQDERKPGVNKLKFEGQVSGYKIGTGVPKDAGAKK